MRKLIPFSPGRRPRLHLSTSGRTELLFIPAGDQIPGWFHHLSLLIHHASLLIPLSVPLDPTIHPRGSTIHLPGSTIHPSGSTIRPS